VYSAGVENLAQARSGVHRIGQLLALTAQADSLNSRNDRAIASVQQRVAGLPRPRVLYVVGVDPPFIAGPGTFIDELITIAGGTNALADAHALWPQVSLEEIVRRQPDVVVVAGGGGDAAAALRLNRLVGWRELAAVRQGHAYNVDAALFNRPGPNVARVAALLADLLHPGAVPAR
jgi:iron complex transport system substrate-binding protein